MTNKLLDFVVIGASKSGTTSLFQYLRTHPEIAIPPGKDAPFFSSDDISLAAWKDFKSDTFLSVDAGLKWGTVTPRYMEHSEIPLRIHSLMPHVQIVAILRNPIDRAFSQYRQQVRLGKEDRPFEAVATGQLEAHHADRARSLDPPSLATEDTYVIRGEYFRILNNFVQHFDREQLHLEYTDDLDDAPQASLERIFRHLGVDSAFLPPNLDERYHLGGTKQRFPWLVPAVRRLAPIRSVWRRIPQAKRQAAWRWFFTTANVKPEPATEIDAATRATLAEFFRPDVQQLEQLVGRPVPWPDFIANAP